MRIHNSIEGPAHKYTRCRISILPQKYAFQMTSCDMQIRTTELTVAYYYSPHNIQHATVRDRYPAIKFTVKILIRAEYSSIQQHVAAAGRTELGDNFRSGQFARTSQYRSVAYPIITII